MSDSKLTAAILIVSDTASQNASTDRCGPALKEVFESDERGSFAVSEVKIVPDSTEAIQHFIKHNTDHADPVNLIITSGGTGFAVKDSTPEAVSPLIHKHATGLVHAMLSASLAITPFAMMARPIAGVRNSTLIITLPGSPKGAKENLEAILRQLPHACQQAAGADSRELHVGGVTQLEQDAGLRRFMTVKGMSVYNCEIYGHVHGSHKAPVPHTKSESHPQSNDPNAGPSRRYRSSPYPMLSVDEALQLIQEHTPSSKAVMRLVDEALVGSVLADDVKAVESVPAFRASIVDGYAIKLPSSGKSVKGIYPVAMISHAQAGDIASLEEGSIARITTGAPLPPGADAVVMVEDTVLKSNTTDGQEEKDVEILTDEIVRGENIREVGSDVQAGETIMKKGEGITAIGGELGLLASVGVRQVLVYHKPVVGVLSTGDEIVPHDRLGDLRLGEVRDTNRPTLLTAIQGSGFKAMDLGIASDKPGALEEALRTAFTHVDVLITTGGVSMGELDLLKPTIERALGGTIHFGRVNMKPGKPTTFASLVLKNPTSGARITKLIFSLPGNPASATVCYHLFVFPSLHTASGISPPGLPKVTVILESAVRCDKGRPEYHRVAVTAKRDGILYANSTGMQRSSRIGSFKSANALLCLPAGKGMLSKGDKVDALLMGQIVGYIDA
ncbi:hypothetical protein EJ05DRAFT_494407 [Pseudovirgaria hyperparasitica]|uniref:MoaB/Mog domain-containing protein n=1 Tax=Pseudovirgaria hyperparasitica TaxID=470096 RepID=A0A6A6VW10_9PEZI|nr:uncharacterized protein EJ05DRAFT_494407 [Pseudovirgaria hyperparasitica]KAF2754423.1 hypothetical protein EJ05DRAFT_494407 [Pseudovirgaria hyperparasitica]